MTIISIHETQQMILTILFKTLDVSQIVQDTGLSWDEVVEAKNTYQNHEVDCNLAFSLIFGNYPDDIIQHDLGFDPLLVGYIDTILDGARV